MMLFVTLALVSSSWNYSRRTKASAIRSAASPTDDEEPLAVYIASVRKPMGIILEENGDGNGARVARIDPRGNVARERADVLINDKILMVDGVQCNELPFDDVMNAIAESRGEVVELTLGRGLSRVRLEWPNGVRTGALAGDSLKQLAAEALVRVKYSCDNGSCGVCEHKILDESLQERYTRVCIARVPKTSSTCKIVPSDRY